MILQQQIITFIHLNWNQNNICDIAFIPTEAVAKGATKPHNNPE